MRIKTRLDSLERAKGEVDVADNRLLVSLLARRDALFWPWRHNGQSRLGIWQRQREYLSGTTGIVSKADGKQDWKTAHEARNRLIQAGYVTAIRSGGEITSLILTLFGEAVGQKLVGDRLRTIRDAVAALVLLSADEWTSESVLFQENLSGDPESWSHCTEIVLPLLVCGLAVSNSDNSGRVGYRRADRELPEDEPEIDVDCDESMDSIYVRAFNSERSALSSCEPLDCSEVWIPLAPSALRVYEQAK
jgi:hypothetical protein